MTEALTAADEKVAWQIARAVIFREQVRFVCPDSVRARRVYRRAKEIVSGFLDQREGGSGE